MKSKKKFCKFDAPLGIVLSPGKVVLIFYKLASVLNTELKEWGGKQMNERIQNVAKIPKYV